MAGDDCKVQEETRTQSSLCCLCRKDTSKELDNDIHVLQPGGDCTQYGLILIYLLKMVSRYIKLNDREY